MHELTVCIRAIWSNEELSPHEKVEQMKWINENQHRLPMRARAIRMNEQPWEGLDAGLELKHWVSQNPTIGGHVGWALKRSIEYADASG